MSSEQFSGDIPEVMPVPEKKRRPCPRCGSEDIIRRLPLLAAAGVSEGVGQEACGLRYDTGQRGLLGGATYKVAPLHLNLCRACGTVTRIFIDHTDQDWWVPPENHVLA
jgi:hypothetical protein